MFHVLWEGNNCYLHKISLLACWRIFIIIPPSAQVVFITLQRNSNSTQNSYSLSSQREEHTTPDSKSLQHSPCTMNNNYNITASHHHHNVETTTTSNIISSHPVYLQSDLWPSSIWLCDKLTMCTDECLQIWLVRWIFVIGIEELTPCLNVNGL